MRNKKSAYESVFRTNTDTDRIIIDIALNDYNEFFHEWDNSAFRKRDIHQELADFLDLCSEEIPLKRKLEIRFCVKDVEPDMDKEARIRASYANYYAAQLRNERGRTKGIFATSGVLLVIALILLFFHVIFSGIVTSSIVTQVLLESLLIGGWVFAWEAIHKLTIDIIKPFHRTRELKRFMQATISFTCG